MYIFYKHTQNRTKSIRQELEWRRRIYS